jgi:hypothetical protein
MNFQISFERHLLLLSRLPHYSSARLYSASKMTSSSTGVRAERKVCAAIHQPARALVFQPEDVLQAYRSWLIDQNRDAKAEQLDEGMVDTFVLDDVFGE